MQIKRVITVEDKGGVAIQTDTINTDAIKHLSNIWGFDRIPTLPLTPAEMLGEYQKKGAFGPNGSARFHYVVSKPETGQGPSLEQLAGSIDMGTGGGMTQGKEGDGIHRTDTIDLIIVIDGEIHVGYPGEDGKIREVTMKKGDVAINNGTFHNWQNRSTKDCLMLFVVIGAERKATSTSAVGQSDYLRSSL